jgi:hypothetical protein
MKPISYRAVQLFLVLMTFSSPFAQPGSAVDTFPYLAVTPPNPVALTDSVKVQIILGIASNSCFAPTFGNLSFVIEESPLTIYPPLFTVKVTFTQDSFPKKICPDVYNPVNYGPIFKLGVLKLGAYQVRDENRTYGKFSVSQAILPSPYCALKGNVYDDPYPLKIASRPIPNAKLYLMSPPIPRDLSKKTGSSIFTSDSTTTDGNGAFTFEKIGKGSYELTCRHKEFRTITQEIQVKSDTSIFIKMVSNNNYAAVAGLVTVIGTNGNATPLEGCNIAIYKGIVLPVVGLSEHSSGSNYDILLSTMTDKDGKYAIDSIPINANPELWFVHAFKGDRYFDYQKVAFYNMKTEKVDFKFVDPYQNRDSVIWKGIVFCTATNKYSYRADEPVKIRYSITNTTDQQVTFGSFNGGCEYELIVTEIPALPSAEEKEIYTQSHQALICYDTLSSINIGPHQTVIHNFADFYLSNISSFAPTNNKVMLRAAALLRGARYDSTKASVPVEIRLDPTSISEKTGKSQRSLTSCDLRDRHIALNLPQAQNISVAVYSLDGKLHRDVSFSRNLTGGAHLLTLNGLQKKKGIYIVGVKGLGFEKKFTVAQMKELK